MSTNLENYISIKELVDRLMRYPIMVNLQYESAIAWAVDVMGLVGSYDLYKDEVDLVPIEYYRGKMPFGIIRVDQCRKVEGAEDNPRYMPMTKASDMFQINYKNYPENYRNKLQIGTYKTQGDYMFTSFERGLVEIAYKTFYTDENSMIMLPTNSSLTKAVEAYIKQEYLRGLYEIDAVSKAVFEEAKQEYCWYIAQAQNSIMNVSVDERQAISNAATRLIWNENFHEDGFRNLGDKEYLRNRR